jgi:hypothetical protein
MRSDVVGCMDECNMMVVIHTDLYSALAAPSITCMQLLSETLLVNCISSLDCAFSLICKMQDDIVLNSCESTLLGVNNVHMAHRTRADAPTYYHVSQCSH